MVDNEKEIDIDPDILSTPYDLYSGLSELVYSENEPDLIIRIDFEEFRKTISHVPELTTLFDLTCAKCKIKKTDHILIPGRNLIGAFD
jgi:hypothetical protein